MTISGFFFFFFFLVGGGGGVELSMMVYIVMLWNVEIGTVAQCITPLFGAAIVPKRPIFRTVP